MKVFTYILLFLFFPLTIGIIGDFFKEDKKKDVVPQDVIVDDVHLTYDNGVPIGIYHSNGSYIAIRNKSVGIIINNEGSYYNFVYEANFEGDYTVTASDIDYIYNPSYSTLFSNDVVYDLISYYSPDDTNMENPISEEGHESLFDYYYVGVCDDLNQHSCDSNDVLYGLYFGVNPFAEGLQERLFFYTPNSMIVGYAPQTFTTYTNEQIIFSDNCFTLSNNEYVFGMIYDTTRNTLSSDGFECKPICVFDSNETNFSLESLKSFEGILFSELDPDSYAGMCAVFE